MSKRKPIDKQEARQRRDRMLDAAAATDLSLTEGVREMRAIAGMTQEEFAQHRGVSARVIKALELGKGNPTVATLNRIGEFFGLEVAFVPVKLPTAEPWPLPVGEGQALSHTIERRHGSHAMLFPEEGHALEQGLRDLLDMLGRANKQADALNAKLESADAVAATRRSR
jgi:DNA-binding XRE family transcriptional regulator